MPGRAGPGGDSGGEELDGVGRGGRHAQEEERFVAFDIVVVALAAAGLLWGAAKGIVRIAIMSAALVAAFLLASWFHRDLATVLFPTGASLVVLRVGAYIAILVAALAAGALLAWLARKMVKAARLGFADRLAGAALGVAAAFVAAAFLLMPIVAYVGGGRWVRSSTLAPYVSVLSDVAARVVPVTLARDYRYYVLELRRNWAGPPPSGAPQADSPARPRGPASADRIPPR